MNYKQLPPDSALKDFVRCYWWLDNSTDQDLNYTIFPDGYFDLLVYFENYQIQNIVLSGLYAKQVDVTIKPNTQLFGIQFRLLAVDYIFQQSISDFLNSGKKLKKDYWNLDKILFQKDLELVRKLNHHIYEIVASQKRIDNRKQQLFKLLYQTKGNETVDFYAQQVFWTSRQINRYFKKQFGLSLKVYCNILKCAASFKHLKKGQLYPEHNYFDRSHFIKELKKHTNKTPKDLFENKNDRFLQLAILTKK